MRRLMPLVLPALLGSSLLVLPALPGAASPPTPFAQGVYTGPANVAGESAFAIATGTSPTIASDYLPANQGWAGIDGASGADSWLFQNAWAHTPYRLSLAVPM